MIRWDFLSANWRARRLSSVHARSCRRLCARPFDAARCRAHKHLENLQRHLCVCPSDSAACCCCLLLASESGPSARAMFLCAGCVSAVRLLLALAVRGSHTERKCSSERRAPPDDAGGARAQIVVACCCCLHSAASGSRCGQRPSRTRRRHRPSRAAHGAGASPSLIQLLTWLG